MRLDKQVMWRLRCTRVDDVMDVGCASLLLTSTTTTWTWGKSLSLLSTWAGVVVVDDLGHGDVAVVIDNLGGVVAQRSCHRSPSWVMWPSTTTWVTWPGVIVVVDVARCCRHRHYGRAVVVCNVVVWWWWPSSLMSWMWCDVAVVIVLHPYFRRPKKLTKGEEKTSWVSFLVSYPSTTHMCARNPPTSTMARLHPLLEGRGQRPLARTQRGGT